MRPEYNSICKKVKKEKKWPIKALAEEKPTATEMSYAAEADVIVIEDR